MEKITFEQVKEICDKQDNCRNCPLLIAKFIEDDDTYDYHMRIVCFKNNYDKVIKAIKYIKKEK